MTVLERFWRIRAKLAFKLGDTLEAVRATTRLFQCLSLHPYDIPHLARDLDLLLRAYILHAIHLVQKSRALAALPGASAKKYRNRVATEVHLHLLHFLDILYHDVLRLNRDVKGSRRRCRRGSALPAQWRKRVWIIIGATHLDCVGLTSGVQRDAHILRAARARARAALAASGN